jgi:hypothetical protein
MTSTVDRENGSSFGWINRPVIEAGRLSEEDRQGKLEEHIYIFGDEERFWLGPEGGQFALFFKPGDDTELGPKVNDTYFGKVPPEYISVKDDVLFFKGDGTRRGKIGISPQRSKGVAGSFDAGGNVLNIVTYNVQPAPHGFVNSMWEHQSQPYQGDVINSYNDGSPAPGEPPLGPFYELETSSPAAALQPGETMQHVQQTLHILGTRELLDAISQRILGVGLEQIQSAW